MFGQSSSPFGGGFGQQQQQQQQNAAPAFGSPPASSGGLFGSTVATPAPTFGAPSSGFGNTGSTFGAPNQPQAQSGGLFGNTGFGGGGGGSTAFGAPAPVGFGAPAAGGGLFGGSAPSGAFGATSTFGAPSPSSGGGLFGSTQPQQSSLFGGQQQQQPQQTSTFGGTGGFGSTQAPTNTFGAPTTGLFGAPAPAAPFGAGPTNAFGAPASNAFGAPPSTGGGLFGSPAPAPSAFGATPSSFGATPTFGAPAAPSSFGAPAPAPMGGGLFGAQPAAPVSGGGSGSTVVPFAPTQKQDGSSNILMQSVTAMPQYERKSVEELRFEDYSQGNRGTAAPAPSGGFGAPSPSGGLFGAPAPAPFGGGGFGAPAPAPFGGLGSTFGAPAQAAGGLFGSPSPAPLSGFGSAPAPASGGLFGATGSTFGAAPQPAPAFGSSVPAPAFGGFGSTPAPAPLFGAPGAGGFGSSPQGGLFGSTPAPAFGAPAPAGGLFGNTAPPAFGSPAPAGGLFGQPAPAPAGGAFGSPAPAPSLFGNQPAPAPVGGFGSFGAPAPSAFGQPAPSPYGMQQPPPMQSPYGMQQPPSMQSPYGMQQPLSVFPPNVQIMPPGAHEILDQQLRALEQARKELENTEVWRGSPSKPAVTTPTNMSNPFGFSSSLSPSTMTSYTPRTGAIKIVPRGYPKSTPSKPSVSLTPNRRDYTDMLMSPEQHIRNSKLQLILKPDSVKPPSRLGQLKLDIPGSPIPSVPTIETVDAPPPDDVPIVQNGTHNQASTPHGNIHAVSSSSQSPLTVTSPGFNYYQKVIGSTDDKEVNGTSSNPTPQKAMNQVSVVPTLTKPGYKTTPSLEELNSMSEGDLAAVFGFSVARPGYGKIEWDGAVDVRSADLDRIVTIESQDVSVYTLDELEGKKPPEQSKLNRPAVITFYGIYPSNGGSQASDDERSKFAIKVKRTTEKMGADFLEYDGQAGVWKIRVFHFSRYGLLNDDDDEEEVEDNFDAPNTDTHKQYDEQFVQSVRRTRKATPFKPSRVTLELTESSDSDMDDDENMVSNVEMTEYDLRKNIEKDAEMAYQEFTSLTKKDRRQTSNEVRFEEFTYEDEGGDIESSDDAVIFDEATITAEFENVSNFSITNHLMSYTQLVKTEVDYGVRMGKSFRVGWLPDGSFLKLADSGAQSSCLVIAHPVLSDHTLSSTSLKLLKSLKNNSVRRTAEDNVCPVYSLPSLCKDYYAASKISSAFEAFGKLCKQDSEAANGFKLLSYLLKSDDANNLPNLKRIVNEPLPVEARIMTDVYRLLANLCSSDIDEEIQDSKYRGDVFTAIMTAISGGDIGRACTLACEAGLTQIAFAISTTTEDLKDIQRLLRTLATNYSSIKTKANPEALRVLDGIGGNINAEGTFFGSTGKLSIDWRRRLIRRILQSRHQNLPDVYLQYDLDMKSGIVPFPGPRYLDGYKNLEVKCIFYQLIHLFAEPEFASVMETINPRGYSSMFQDFSLAFHFGAAISACNVHSSASARLSSTDVETIIDGYAAQLIQAGYWDLAVFVSLFIVTEITTDVISRKIERAKEIILRSYTNQTSESTSRREFLENDVGVPTEWFEQALTYRCSCTGNSYDYVNHSLAFDPEKGFQAFQEIILPSLFFRSRSEIDSMMILITSSLKNDNTENDSSSLIAAMHSYFNLDKEIHELSKRFAIEGSEMIITYEELNDYLESYDYIDEVFLAYEARYKRGLVSSSSSIQNNNDIIFPIPLSKVQIPAMLYEAREHLRFLKVQIDSLKTES